MQTHLASERKFIIVPTKRAYLVNGRKLPRVTTILNVISKPWLIEWERKQTLRRVNDELVNILDQTIEISRDFIDDLILRADSEAANVRDQAADLGKRAHEAVAKFLRGEEPEISPDVLPCYEAFLNWRKDSGIEVIGSELCVASVKHGFAGTLDAIGRHDGKLVLLDWKSSKAIYPIHSLQVAAYCLAWEEEFEEKVEEAWIVRFPKDHNEGDEDWKPVEAKQIMNLEGAKEAFLNAKRCYDDCRRDFFKDAIRSNC